MDADIERVLTKPAAWRVVCAFAPPDVAPVDDARNRAWRAAHAEAHARNEILLGLSGRVPCRFGEAVYPVTAGTWLVFQRGVLHDYGYAPTADRALHAWLHLLPDGINVTLFRIRRGDYLALARPPHIDDPALSRWVAAELDRLRASPAGPDLAGRGLRAVLAVLAARLHETLRAPREAESRHGEAVRRVARLVAARHGVDVYGPHLARIAGYSHFHFLRLFKRATGKTLHRYADDARHERFAQLAAARLGRKEIARELGFSSASALAHWVRKRSRRPE